MNLKAKIGICLGAVMVALAFLEASAASKGLRLELKLSAGMFQLAGGDVNDYITHQHSYWERFGTGMGYVVEGGLEEARLGPEASGEVILYVSPRFGISLSSGFILATKDSGMTSAKTGIRRKYTNREEVRAIPVFMGLYFDVPITGGIGLYAQAGGGYYLAQWSNAWREDIESIGPSWTTEDQKATGSGWGIQAGLGLDVRIFRFLSFFVEGYGHYAKIGGLEGDYAWRSSYGGSNLQKGSLYHYEELSGGIWYPTVIITQFDLSSAPWVRNLRKATMDLSGLAVRAGFKIKFG